MSKIVVLNGASSAGKTSTANALLDLLGPTCVHRGLITYWSMLNPLDRKPVQSSASFDVIYRSYGFGELMGDYGCSNNCIARSSRLLR